MTLQTRRMVDKLLGDLRKNPDIPAHQAIQAVLLGSIKMNLSIEEYREVLDILRMEYGFGRQRWAETVVILLKSMPEEFRKQNQSIIIP